MIPIYKALQQRLNDNITAFNEAGLPPVNHIDLFKEQYLNFEDEELYDCPAVFYQYEADWESDPDGTEHAEVTVTLHIQTDNGYNTFGKEEDTGLKDLEFYNLVHMQVQNLEGDTFSKLKRFREEPDTNPTNVHVHKIMYKCRLTDNCTNNSSKYEEVEVDELEVKLEEQKFQI